jgi:chorismate mutase
MWIFLSDAFVSIVAPQPGRGVDPAEFLIVRARVAGDIEAVFPDADVTENQGTDYKFRAVVPRTEVADRLAEEARSITYMNFKDTVTTQRRHDAYLRVWRAMAELQNDHTGHR